MSQRVVFAGAWTLALRLSARGLGTIRIIVLARLLVPEAFGLVAVALLTNELVNQLTATGFNFALVQRKGDIKGYLNTVWTMLLLRGFVLGGILVTTAPVFAALFNAPQATPFIQTMAVVLVLRGLINSGVVYFNKELEIHKRFLWEMSIAVTEFVVAISTAIILRNAWALVYGTIAGNIVGVIVSYVIHPYRPRIELDFRKAKELFSFGIWLLFNAIVLYIITRVDSIVIGRFLGVMALGLYTIAHTISDIVTTEVSHLANNVFFPAYSKLQNDITTLRQAFLAGIEAISLITLPFAAVVFVLAPDFIPLVLGNQWTSVAPIVGILSFAAAIFALLNLGGSLYMAVGKPRLYLIMIAIASVIMVALLIPLTAQFGLHGAATAMLIGNCTGLLFLTWAIMKILKTNLLHILRSFISPIAISLILSVSLMLVKHVLGGVNISGFVTMVVVATLVYITSAFLLWRIFHSGPIQIIILLRGRQ